MTAELSFRLPMEPEWAHIDSIRRSVVTALGTVFANKDYSDSISMVVTELLENAVKYGSWRENTELRLFVQGNAEQMVVEVSNPIDTHAEPLNRLFKAIERLHQHRSVREAYEEVLRLAGSRNDQGHGGIGIARIAYEGDCHLEASVYEGILTVRAISKALAELRMTA